MTMTIPPPGWTVVVRNYGAACWVGFAWSRNRSFSATFDAETADEARRLAEEYANETQALLTSVSDTERAPPMLLGEIE
jgi:hypothetical protein